VLPFAVVAALLLGSLPLLALHARQLWLRPHYQFFPLLLLGSAFLAWQRLRGCGPLRPGHPLLSAALLLGSCGLFAAAELFFSSWLGAVSTMVLLAALLYTFGGWRLFRLALPAWVLLWLAVPPPLELDRDLILALQGWTTRATSAVLDLLGVFHLMAGNVVEVDGRKLLVEEACSGINSLFSVLACTLFLVFATRRPPLHSVVLLVAAVGWVLAANVARIVLVVLLETRWGVDVSTGWRHDAIGASLFVVAVALLWSTDQFLLFLGSPSAAAPSPGAAAPPPRADVTPAASGPPWRLLVGVAALYCLLGVSHLAVYGTGSGAAPGGAPPVAFDQFGEDRLPAEVGGWRREKFGTETRQVGSAFGEQSRTWVYEKSPHRAVFSLDYPFPAWHDLTRCYTGQGWEMEEQDVYATDGEVPDAVWVVLNKPAYRSGYLLFCQLDGEGRPLDPRRGGAYMSLYRHGSMAQRWRQRFLGGDAAPEDPPGPVYQVQLLVESAAPLTEADRKAVRELFAGLKRSVQEQWPGRAAEQRAGR
jgi:exosortase